MKVYLPDIGEKLLSNIWYVSTFKKKLLSLVTIRQAGHAILMRDGLIKINSIKHNYKIVVKGYEDGKLLRMKGTVIPQKHDFATIVG